MKIFQVITVSEYGGAQTIVANLTQGFDANNDIYILFGGDGEAWKDLNDARVHLIKLNAHRKDLSWKDISVAAKLFYYRLKYRPDIVHLHSSKMGVLGRILFNPKKVVLTMHGFDSVRKAFRKFLVVEKKLKNRAACIVGVSQYDVDCMKEEGIERNVRLVYNGVVDHSLNLNIEADPIIMDKLRAIREEYPFVIMCLSRISKQKKFNLFLDIARARPNYAFVWIGNKTEIDNHPSNVFCLGEAYSAHQYFRFADIFVLPSNYEGLPMSLLEALSYGIPVVASAVGGITEVLDGTNGFAVENTVSDFTDKIDIVLRENMLPMMKEKARESYLKNFTIGKMVSGYSAIYNQIYNK